MMYWCEWSVKCNYSVCYQPVAFSLGRDWASLVLLRSCVCTSCKVLIGRSGSKWLAASPAVPPAAESAWGAAWGYVAGWSWRALGWGMRPGGLLVLPVALLELPATRSRTGLAPPRHWRHCCGGHRGAGGATPTSCCPRSWSSPALPQRSGGPGWRLAGGGGVVIAPGRGDPGCAAGWWPKGLGRSFSVSLEESMNRKCERGRGGGADTKESKYSSFMTSTLRHYIIINKW